MTRAVNGDELVPDAMSVQCSMQTNGMGKRNDPVVVSVDRNRGRHIAAHQCERRQGLCHGQPIWSISDPLYSEVALIRSAHQVSEIGDAAPAHDGRGLDEV